MDTHTVVGELTDMIVARTRRINLESLGCTVLLDDCAEHPLCGRRTAYVAQAHEQHPNLFFCLQ